MGGDRVRDEAERLVAAAIAAVSYAARGFGAGNRPGSGFATGSPECCVCPVCRAIAAMREPAPEFADRLAAGVGDLAAGVTSVLRTLQRPGSGAPTQRPGTSDADEFWESLRRKAADAAKAAAETSSTADTADDDPWRAATAEPPSPANPPPAAPVPPAAMAVVKKAVAKKAVVKKAVVKKAVAKKAVANKAVANKAVANKAGAKRPAAQGAPSEPPAPRAKKAVAKNAVAKKAVAKKAVAKRSGGNRPPSS